MELFSRSIIGYHGCEKDFAHALLLGDKKISEWNPSNNKYNWLGKGIYFWEHSPDRAMRWAELTGAGKPAVLGAYLQLGRCFDLLHENITLLLRSTYVDIQKAFQARNEPLPKNKGKGKDKKFRELDCTVINQCIADMKAKGVIWDTVRGAFLEGEPAYPSAGFSIESHIQIAVRDAACILGVFQPNI